MRPIGLVLLVGLLFGQPAERVQAARQAFLAGRYADAAKIYRELVRENPGQPGLRLSLGLALEKAGQPGEAIPELEACVRAQPDLAGAWFLLGLAQQQLGHPREAIAPLRHALQLDPKNDQARLELADAELASGNPRDAAAEFRALTENRPGMAKAWYGLALSYLASGERAFSKVGEVAPASGFWIALLGRAQAAEGHDAEALRLYADAIQASPGLQGLHAARAAIFRAQGQTALAEAEGQEEARVPRPDCRRDPAACACLEGAWEKALNEARQSPAVSNLYWASIGAGKLAEQSFAHLAALPESAEVHEMNAEAQQRMGRRTDAVAEWRKALAMRPEDRRLRARLAESLLKNREYEEAQKLLEPLAQASPENGEWRYLLGETLFEQRRTEEALPHLLAAQRLLPDHLPALEALGRAYLQLDQADKAIPLLERARPVDEGPIEFALSSAYRKVGREQEAAAALARYRELTGAK